MLVHTAFVRHVETSLQLVSTGGLTRQELDGSERIQRMDDCFVVVDLLADPVRLASGLDCFLRVAIMHIDQHQRGVRQRQLATSWEGFENLEGAFDTVTCFRRPNTTYVEASKAPQTVGLVESVAGLAKQPDRLFLGLDRQVDAADM